MTEQQTPEATISIRRLTLGLERMRTFAKIRWETSLEDEDAIFYMGQTHAIEEVIASLEELK